MNYHLRLMGMSLEEEHEFNERWDSYRKGYANGFKAVLLKWRELMEQGKDDDEIDAFFVEFFNKTVLPWKEQSFWDVQSGDEEEIEHPQP